MKKTFVSAILVIVILWNSVNAQSNTAIVTYAFRDNASGRWNVATDTNALTPNSISAANGTIQNKELRVNNIAISARRNFMRSFKDVQNAEWHTIKDGYSAYFNQEGSTVEIRYSKDGRWLCNIRTCYEDQLIPSIKNLVKSKYKNYTVVIVQEYESNNGTVWIVSLDSKSEQILVRVEEDEIREVHHFYKSE